MNSVSYAVCLGVFCAIFMSAGAKQPTNECVQMTGIGWIIQERGADYGWKEHTHRATIALAVANKLGTGDKQSRSIEAIRMELQLELELTKFLARIDSSSLSENDLALFVQALLARNKNPRDFHGFDLVAELLRRVDARGGRGVHPFLVLALCDAGAVKPHHLLAIQGYTKDQETESRYLTEMKALTLKAYACAVANKDAEGLVNLHESIESAVKSLISRQNETDGSFGNAYTTALVVQALFACETRYKWEKEKALNFLKLELAIQVNMIKTYLIVMAQNAERVKFVKDLYRGPPSAPEREVDSPDNHFVTIVIQPPKTFSFGMRMEVPRSWNAYQILEMFSELNIKFNFTSYLNVEGKEIINSISGIPNDAEENQFWVLCRDQPIYHFSKHDGSPETLVPSSNETIYFHYGESLCRPNGRGSFF